MTINAGWVNFLAWMKKSLILDHYPRLASVDQPLALREGVLVGVTVLAGNLGTYNCWPG
jgi:hypothetical protein